MIGELIDKVDNVELIRDRIGEILLRESANQQVLALSAFQIDVDPAEGNTGTFELTADPRAGQTLTIGTYTLVAGTLVDGTGTWTLTDPDGADETFIPLLPTSDLEFPTLGIHVSVTNPWGGTVFATGDSADLLVGKPDPRLWKLRVFLERSHPWEEFQDAPDNDTDEAVPIVNVWLNTQSTDVGKSDPIERQKVGSVFNVDCYGYGKAEAEADGAGHIVGDERAAFECQRAVRLVRKILMAGTYTYLGFPRGANQVVHGRMVETVTYFQPQLNETTVQNVIAARVAFHVDHNEFSPQVQGEPLELVSLKVNKVSNGELLLQADYPLTE